MKLHYIKEPLLEFGQGSHICPRAGITNYDVYDTKLKIRRERVLVGAVGTSDTLSKLYAWLEKCSQPIPAKPDSRQPNLFVPFCGFKSDLGFKALLVIDEEITRVLNNSDINAIIQIKDWNERVYAAVELYYRQARFLAQNRVTDVITCVIPTRLYDKFYKQEITPVEETLENEEDGKDDVLEVNFRRALKAKAMSLGKPL